MEQIFMIVGFLFAAYAVVGNDAIQTLGTFLSSNSRRPWWVLWLYASSILVFVLAYGYITKGDVSYGRLEKIPQLETFYWFFIIPPVVLLVITRFGIPVSTTFLILSVFTILGDNSNTVSFQEILSSIISTDKLIGKMLFKSILGYLLAFGIAIFVYLTTSKFVEKHFIDTYKKDRKIPITWMALQWVATGFLWSMWLIQDMANIYVYLPRPLNVSYFIFSVATFVTLQGILFYSRGGEIQKIVTSKTNTLDIRSATIIDLIYGLVLLYFKEYSKVPMSTTWVFVGLLAGREFAINFILNIQSISAIGRIVMKDLIKVVLGLIISIALVMLISLLKG